MSYCDAYCNGTLTLVEEEGKVYYKEHQNDLTSVNS